MTGPRLSDLPLVARTPKRTFGDIGDLASGFVGKLDSMRAEATKNAMEKARQGIAQQQADAATSQAASDATRAGVDLGKFEIGKTGATRTREELERLRGVLRKAPDDALKMIAEADDETLSKGVLEWMNKYAAGKFGGESGALGLTVGQGENGPGVVNLRSGTITPLRNTTTGETERRKLTGEEEKTAKTATSGIGSSMIMKDIETHNPKAVQEAGNAVALMPKIAALLPIGRAASVEELANALRNVGLSDDAQRYIIHAYDFGLSIMPSRYGLRGGLQSILPQLLREFTGVQVGLNRGGMQAVQTNRIRAVKGFKQAIPPFVWQRVLEDAGTTEEELFGSGRGVDDVLKELGVQ